MDENGGNFLFKTSIFHWVSVFMSVSHVSAHFCICVVSFSLQEATGPYCYLIFCAICFGVAIYAIFIIPETKNKTFLEISQMFASRNKIPSEELASNGHLKMALMNGYGTLGIREEK